MNDLLSYLQKEWSVLASAPFTFLSFFLLSSAVAFAVIKFRYDGLIETLRERMQAKEEQLSTYRERLHLVKEHTSFSILGNTELKDKALELVGNIRQFMLKRRKISDGVLHQRFDKPNATTTEEERQRDWNEHTNRIISESTITHSDYNKEFKADTIILRDELLSILPKNIQRAGHGAEHLIHTYEHPTPPTRLKPLTGG